MQTITFFEPDRGRPCDGCTQCCSWLSGQVQGHYFGNGVSCTFLKGNGCGIYDTRPDGCRSFQCHWKTELSIPDWLKPSQVNVIMKQEQINRFKYISIVYAGTPDPRVFDWIEEQVESGVNFIIYEPRQLLSKDEDFIQFDRLLNTKFGV
jgi:hypothetical protein